MHSVTIATPAGEIQLETGRIARQAHGSVILRHRDTVLLATAVSAEEPPHRPSFFPLTVEYRERMAAAGRIPGAYGRREGRITDNEVLTSRLADRSIRPLFPSGYLCDTQVLLTVLSADKEVEPSSFAILAAAAALHISDIPWAGPIAGLRIARTRGVWEFFPTREQREAAELDLVVSAGPGGLIMVEGQGAEASEERVQDGLRRADEALRAIIAGIEQLRELAGKPKREFRVPEPDAEIAAATEELAAAPIAAAVAEPGKHARRAAITAASRTAAAALAERFPEREGEIKEALSALSKRVMRQRIAGESCRPDGRGPKDIRPISGDAGWLPRCHGSAVFTRGETQALVSCTLGTMADEQRVETLEGGTVERFLLHYNFPPYSVGETRPMRGPGRREIGHGNLAWRALQPLMPNVEDFAYTVRLVSDISESNGSSSMATVCGGSLALMDAGVPLKRPVAGIAMGLIREGDDYVVLSDILGDEDHLGDMDFKVAGTENGITAIQMDNKLGAIPAEVLEGALTQAREGRLHILGEMAKTLESPREELADSAPRVRSLNIRPERIRDVIGAGGKTIQEIQQKNRVRIDVNDTGLVRIYANDAEGAREAFRRVHELTFDPELGRVYRGRVILVRDFFAIVGLGPTIEGRLHISELENHRVETVGDVLKKGDEVVVRVMGVDKQGKITLSRKAAFGEEPA